MSYIFLLRLNKGALGEELVDQTDLAFTRGEVKGGPAVLRWRGAVGRAAWAEEGWKRRLFGRQWQVQSKGRHR
jgi:hypothetical protein